MRLHLLSILLASSAALTAQSPLTTTFANNNSGSVGGGVYFNLTANEPLGISICRIAVNLNSVAGTAGSIDVFIVPTSSVPHTQFAAAVPVASASVISAGPGQPSVLGPLSAPIFIPGGTTVGVAYRAVGVALAYTNGTGAYPVPGNIFGAGQQLVANAGQASNAFGAGTAFSPRMVNTRLDYIAGAVPCPPIATAVPQGAGCVAAFASVYELFATSAAFDLAGTSITLTNTGGSYTVTAGGTYHAVGSLAPATSLVLTDDSQVAAGTLGISVGSNGWIALGTGNSNVFGPTAALMLGNPSTAFYSWHDMNPEIIGSGQVQYEELGTLAQVTYDGVWDFGGTSALDANHIQFQIDTATGNVVISWGFMSTLGASGVGHGVGYSPGGASADPGASDLSTLGTLTLTASDVLPLSLTGVGRPVQGAVAVAYNVTTGNIPATVLSQIGIIGLSRPGMPLDGLGLPGCFLHTSDEILDFVLAPTVTSPSYTWTALTLPAGAPFYYGFEFNVQAVAFGTPANTFLGLGAVTSNGLKCTVGGL